MVRHHLCNLFLFINAFSLIASVAPAEDDLAPERPKYFMSRVGSPTNTQEKIDSSFGLALMGGGPSLDSAFKWMARKAPGGDAVVIRAQRVDDSYNNYLFNHIGGFNSVTTISLMNRDDASNAKVLEAVRAAHFIFIAGGNQYNYHRLIKNTLLHKIILDKIAERKIPIGGKSAGLAILGEYYFSAQYSTAETDVVLKDPYDQVVTLENGFLNFNEMKNVVTDTHFSERNRMGRLLVFMARIMSEHKIAPIGIGVDEENAMLIEPDGSSRVVGAGAVYEVRASTPPAVLQKNHPLDFRNLSVRIRTEHGETFKKYSVENGVIKIE